MKSKTAQITQKGIEQIITPTSSKQDIFLKSVSRKSVRTEKVYTTALNHLSNFINDSYPDYNVDSIIDAMLQNKINVYQLLDNFISYIQSIKEGITANSISVYVAGLRSYFSYYDIDIIPSKFKRKVFLPKIPREDEQPLDSSDIRKILLNCSNRRLLTYLLILASGGMRTVEALAIRNRDIDFSSSPTKIHLRKDFSKVKIGRDIYISDEATRYLKNWLDFKYNNPKHPRVKGEDDLIFAIYQTAKSPERLYQRIIREFQKVLKIVELDERKEDGIGHRRRITLHSFRRHCKSVIATQTNTDYSEWFLGHSHSPYWTLKEVERRHLYETKCMKYLTFLDYTTLEATGKNIESKLEEKDKQIKSMKAKYDEDIALLKDAVTDMQQLLKNPQKLVDILTNPTI